MVIPIYDNDPLEKSHQAFVNWTLIALNVAAFLVQINVTEDATLVITRDYALIPAAIIGKVTLGGSLPPILSVFTYMFLHGGWMHLIGNMLFLWVLGDNIEDAMGHLRYFFFYMLCGAAGGIAFLLSGPDAVVPLIGASGAVAGVVAAYLMLRPCAKITFLAFGFLPLRLGSAWVLGFWVLVQIWNVITVHGGNTAWWAHIGGLAAGAVLVVILRRPDVTLFECLRPGDVMAVKEVLSQTNGTWRSR
jgi:membrane associated rhomboid family serine protease